LGKSERNEDCEGQDARLERRERHGYWVLGIGNWGVPEPHQLRFTFHVSRFTFHVSRFTLQYVGMVKTLLVSFWLRVT
jgi:hypothetical protein